VFVYIVEKNISVLVKDRGLVSVENVQFPKNLFALGNVTRGRISPVANFITFIPEGKPMGEDMGENMAGPRRPISAFNWFESGVIILLEQRPLRGETTCGSFSVFVLYVIPPSKTTSLFAQRSLSLDMSL
jgi:hypothetical protein